MKKGEGDVRPFTSIGKPNGNLPCGIASVNQNVSLAARCEGGAEA
ncbi:hypothetical protein [Sphingobium yanoikuyae]|nr:hypothetical protein [Sphingobium yanoikuyae]